MSHDADGIRPTPPIDRSEWNVHVDERACVIDRSLTEHFQRSSNGGALQEGIGPQAHACFELSYGGKKVVVLFLQGLLENTLVDVGKGAKEKGFGVIDVRLGLFTLCLIKITDRIGVRGEKLRDVVDGVRPRAFEGELPVVIGREGLLQLLRVAIIEKVSDYVVARRNGIHSGDCTARSIKVDIWDDGFDLPENLLDVGLGHENQFSFGRRRRRDEWPFDGIRVRMHGRRRVRVGMWDKITDRCRRVARIRGQIYHIVRRRRRRRKKVILQRIHVGQRRTEMKSGHRPRLVRARPWIVDRRADHGRRRRIPRVDCGGHPERIEERGRLAKLDISPVGQVFRLRVDNY